MEPIKVGDVVYYQRYLMNNHPYNGPAKVIEFNYDFMPFKLQMYESPYKIFNAYGSELTPIHI